MRRRLSQAQVTRSSRKGDMIPAVYPEQWAEAHWSLLKRIWDSMNDVQEDTPPQTISLPEFSLRCNNLGGRWTEKYQHQIHDPWDDSFSTIIGPEKPGGPQIRFMGHDDFDVLRDLISAKLVQLIDRDKTTVRLTQAGQALGHLIYQGLKNGTQLREFYPDNWDARPADWPLTRWKDQE